MRCTQVRQAACKRSPKPRDNYISVTQCQENHGALYRCSLRHGVVAILRASGCGLMQRASVFVEPVMDVVEREQ